MPQATPAAAMSALVLKKPRLPVRNLVARRARLRPERPSVPRKTIDSTSAGLFNTAFVPPNSRIRSALLGVPSKNSNGGYLLFV
jgi:hypothetical protein